MTGMSSQLWFKILIGLILGVLVGYALGPDLQLVTEETGLEAGSWLALPGDLFLILIKFIVIPLVISSIILGIADGEDVARIKKMGLSIVGYFIATSTVAAAISITITLLMRPGEAENDYNFTPDPSALPDPQDIAADIPAAITRIFPDNFFEAMANGSLLHVVVGSIIFGVALLAMKRSQSTPLMQALNTILAASLLIIKFIMKFAPYAVFGLIAEVVIVNGLAVMGDLGYYIMTFLVILAAILVFYASVLIGYSKRNPIEFAKAVREPFVFAFSTSSSSATMPITLKAAEENLGISKTVRRMVVPVGATVNLDGTAAYQAVVIIFLAQLSGLPLDLSQIVLLVALSVAASVGAPGVPGGSLAILVGIVTDFGIPIEGFALILAVDRPLDMCRTAVNVTGDLVTCTVMERLTGGKPG